MLLCPMSSPQMITMLGLFDCAYVGETNNALSSKRMALKAVLRDSDRIGGFRCLCAQPPNHCQQYRLMFSISINRQLIIYLISQPPRQDRCLTAAAFLVGLRTTAYPLSQSAHRGVGAGDRLDGGPVPNRTKAQPRTNILGSRTQRCLCLTLLRSLGSPNSRGVMSVF